MELQDYLRALRKSRILILVCTLIGVGIAAAFLVTSTPKYVAETEMYVSVRTDNSAAATTDLAQGSSFAMQAVDSYASVATSARVLDRVVSELRLPESATSLAKSVSVSSPLNTVLLDISVTNTNPALAARIADSVGSNTAYVVVNELEKSPTNTPSPVQIESLAGASTPTSPSSPKVPEDLLLGLLLGLLAGLALAILRSVLDTRIHSSTDIEQVTDAPILGGISIDPDMKKRPLIVHADPRNPRAESFRSLRTNLQFLNVADRPRSYVITSSVAGEGKSTTAANLAISLAETGAKVTLIDGDLRLPKIAEYMGIEGGVGLTDILIGRAELVDVLQKWGAGQLYVLPSGRIPPNPSELLGSKSMEHLLQILTEECDYVIVDAPPLLPVTDAAVLSKYVGGTLLVTASGRTKKTELAAAVRTLERIGSRLAGIVMNMVPTRGPDSDAYEAYGYPVQHEFDELKDSTPKRARRDVRA